MWTIKNFLSQQWDAIIASVIASMAMYFLTIHSGIGLSPDSISYSSSAGNIKDHFALLDFNGLPLVDFPAGYPFFLAMFYAITGIIPIAFAPFLNSLLYVGVILLSGIIMDGFTQTTRGYRIMILSILATSPCLWEVYSMLWSETLFLFLAMLFFLQWKQYVQNHSYKDLLLLAVITAIAFATRFAGITILATGLALILFDGSVPFWKKIKQGSLYFVIGISLVALNLYRNQLITDTAAGVREKALRSVVDNLLDIGSVLGEWLPFLSNHKAIGAGVFLLLVVVAKLGYIFRILQQQFYHKIATAINLYLLVYAVFIVGVSSISRFEILSSRLLSPIYIPLILVATAWILPMMKNQTKFIRRGILIVGMGLFIFCMKNQYKLNAANWEGIAFAGIPGYSEDQWTLSPMIQHINQHKDSIKGPVYSDAPGGLYHLTGIRSLPLPHNEILKEQNELLAHKNLIVVWFTDGINHDLIDMPFIQKYKAPAAIRTFSDGFIYYFKDKDSSTVTIH